MHFRAGPGRVLGSLDQLSFPSRQQSGGAFEQPKSKDHSGIRVPCQEAQLDHLLMRLIITNRHPPPPVQSFQGPLVPHPLNRNREPGTREGRLTDSGDRGQNTLAGSGGCAGRSRAKPAATHAHREANVAHTHEQDALKGRAKC